MSNIDSRTRAQIGRTSRRKGIDAEQAVARYLAERGWPGAKRRVRTGWKVGDKVARDEGDIDGIDPLCCQVKTRSTELSDNGIRAVLAEAADQAVAAGADIPFVVERRAGKSDPGHWWAWLYVGDLYNLIESGRNPDVLTVTTPLITEPARLRLADLVTLLHRAGHGVAA
jgi:Holliday junction resolvase-like predicted endonuclease